MQGSIIMDQIKEVKFRRVLNVHLPRFDKKVLEIRSAICGLETDGSDSDKKIAEFRPILKQLMHYANKLMRISAELLEVHIVVNIRDVIFDLQEQFDEIEHRCPLDV